MLKTRSTLEAQGIVMRIRDGHAVELIVSQVKDSDLLLHMHSTTTMSEPLQREANVVRVPRSEPSRPQPQAPEPRYEDTDKHLSAYEELYRILQSMSEEQSVNALKRIRTRRDVHAVLRELRQADILLQLKTVPEDRLRYNFPFYQAMPTFILNSNNPYLRSPIYETPFALPSHGSPAGTTDDTPFSGPYMRPFSAADVFDPLIDKAPVSNWTTVSSDNVLLRRLLKTYFYTIMIGFLRFTKIFFWRICCVAEGDFVHPCSSTLCW